MIVALFLLGSADAARSQPVVTTGNPITEGLSNLFVQACVFGELRLTPDVGRPMSADELGYELDYGKNRVAQGQYYNIAKPGAAVLKIIDWAPGHQQGWARSCHLGSNSLDLNSAWKYVTKAVFGRQSRRIPRALIYRLDVPARGYTLRVTQGSLGTVIYDKPTAEKMLAEWRRRGSKPAVPVAEDSFCTSEMLCG